MIAAASKRIATLLVLLLTLGILVPSGIKLAHALHGHKQEHHCTTYGTDHIHPASFHCDFHDLTLVPHLFWVAIPPPLTPVIFYPNSTPKYTFSTTPHTKAAIASRGPPSCVS